MLPNTTVLNKEVERVLYDSLARFVALISLLLPFTVPNSLLGKEDMTAIDSLVISLMAIALRTDSLFWLSLSLSKQQEVHNVHAEQNAAASRMAYHSAVRSCLGDQGSL